MRRRALAFALLFATLVPAAPAGAATTYAFECPPAPADDGTTHWTGGGNTVNATPVSGSPGAWSVSCGYSGSSTDGQLRIYRPNVGASFYDETASTTHLACYRPGRVQSGTHYSSTAQASASRNADPLYAALEGARESLLGQAEVFAARCPVVQCPYDFDGDRLLSDVVNRPSFGRSLLSCYYRPATGSGGALVFSLSWLNATVAAGAANSSYLACFGRSLPKDNVTREGFEVYAAWRWESTATTAELPATARAFARNLLPIATDAAACPGATAAPTPRAPPSATPPASTTPAPPTPETAPSICPARYVTPAGFASALLEMRWTNDSSRGLSGATCAYELPPDETRADVVALGRLVFVADYRTGPGIPPFGCAPDGDPTSEFQSLTHQATIRWDESLVRWGNLTRFAADHMMPLVERFAIECTREMRAAADAAPCPAGFRVTYSVSGESAQARLRSQEAITTDPATGWSGFACYYRAEGGRLAAFPFSSRTTWATVEGTSSPHWACSLSATEASAGGTKYRVPASGMRSLGTEISQGEGRIGVFPEVSGLVFRFHEWVEERVAPCAGTQTIDVGAKVGTPAPGAAAGMFVVALAACLRRLRAGEGRKLPREAYPSRRV